VWPFLSWCFAAGRVVPDLELIAAKSKGAHFSLWASMHSADITELRAAAASFDWTPIWLDRIVANAYPLLGLVRSVTLHRITSTDLDAVDADIAASMLLPGITKAHLTTQNHGLRALCYQLGVIDNAPVHPNLRPRTPAQRASGVPQPRIREVIAHYLATVDTILRPKTVVGRAESLTGFALWLAKTHPEIGAIPELTRTPHRKVPGVQRAAPLARPARQRQAHLRSSSCAHRHRPA
jgi:hypothetical protein